MDTGVEEPQYPAPDCAGLALPGDPEDVALTPRANHDAEVLALAVDPALAVAPQERYAIVADDLAAILEVEPVLEEVHVGCVFPNGIAFSFHGEPYEVMQAIFENEYHAWDCHNAYYDLAELRRTDGVVFAIRLDGVFSEPVAKSYETLSGLSERGDYWFRVEGQPTPSFDGYDCQPAAGTITLDATLAPAGGLDVRTYTFEHPEHGVFVYRVDSESGPERIG